MSSYWQFAGEPEPYGSFWQAMSPAAAMTKRVGPVPPAGAVMASAGVASSEA